MSLKLNKVSINGIILAVKKSWGDSSHSVFCRHYAVRVSYGDRGGQLRIRDDQFLGYSREYESRSLIWQ